MFMRITRLQSVDRCYRIDTSSPREGSAPGAEMSPFLCRPRLNDYLNGFEVSAGALTFLGPLDVVGSASSPPRPSTR